MIACSVESESIFLFALLREVVLRFRPHRHTYQRRCPYPVPSLNPETSLLCTLYNPTFVLLSQESERVYKLNEWATEATVAVPYEL